MHSTRDLTVRYKLLVILTCKTIGYWEINVVVTF